MIETERTILRPVAGKDKHEIFSYRSDSLANQYQAWIPKTLDEVSEFISNNPKEINLPGTWFQLAVVKKIQGVVIGDIGLHFIDSENRQCELGITISKHYHGQGIAQETMRAIIGHLFGDLQKHRIIASLDPRNSKSVRLCEGLGFRKEGHFKESLLIAGQWVDDVIYAILSREWNEKARSRHGKVVTPSREQMRKL